MTLFILKYIFIASVFALYIIKVYVITFFKKELRLQLSESCKRLMV